MSERIDTDICVIGGGSGGLSVAAAAAAFSVPVVLVEKGKMGGDCLNYGCVPSKAMIAAAKRAHQARHTAPFGIANSDPQINFGRVNDHVHSVIGAIAPNDSVERFTGLGVRVFQGEGQFTGPKTFSVNGMEIHARRFVIATGSSAAIPPIPGLDEVDYLTNETIFDLRRRPSKLAIIGGGPIGIELAQAFQRLGSEVTVLEMFAPLGKDDPEATSVVLKSVRRDGVTIHDGIKILRVEKRRGGVRIVIDDGDGERNIDASDLLVAAGRKPNVSGLGLEAANVGYTDRGIAVNKRLKTSNSKIYAIGDVIGGLQFTHMANYHAGLVIRNALFRMPVKVSTAHIPWVTYTDPELAHVGLSEAQAAESHKNFRVLRWPYHENDRAQSERETEGFIKVITDKKGVILGATIVGAHAGEIINMWSLAISQRMKVGAFAGYVSPYPTLAEIGKRASVEFYKPSLSNVWLRRAIEFLRKFG